MYIPYGSNLRSVCDRLTCFFLFVRIPILQPDRVIEFLLYSLDQDSKEVQATAAVGISKLMLSGIITNSEVSYRSS